MAIKHTCNVCGQVGTPPELPKCSHDNFVTDTYDPVWAASLQRKFNEDEQAFQEERSKAIQRQEMAKAAKIKSERRKSGIIDKVVVPPVDKTKEVVDLAVGPELEKKDTTTPEEN